MQQGWTNKGVYTANGKIAVYRIEQSVEGFYMFIFTENMECNERDELQDTLEIVQRSAVDNWGANEKWVYEKWKYSFNEPSNREHDLKSAEFPEKMNMTLLEYLSEDSIYLSLL